MDPLQNPGSNMNEKDIMKVIAEAQLHEQQAYEAFCAKFDVQFPMPERTPFSCSAAPRSTCFHRLSGIELILLDSEGVTISSFAKCIDLQLYLGTLEHFFDLFAKRKLHHLGI